MKLLLDTHSFLWFIGGSPHLSASAQTLIEDAGNEIFLSVASLWESEPWKRISLPVTA